MPYLYANNVNPQDRFDQVSIQMDNGVDATLRRGHVYSLSASELARARAYVVMVDSDAQPESPGGGGALAASGVGYVATDAELSPTAAGHPVVLVLADSAAQGLAALRYWTGTEWKILGLAGGGTVESNFIDITFAGTLQNGQTIAWDAVDARFEPAGVA